MNTEAKPVDLTLFGIESSIVELLAFRDEVADDPDMTPSEITESLKAIDESIQGFISRELVKVDGVAHVLREMEARAEVAKKERDRLAERVRVWERRHDLLEERIKEALQFRLQATGQKKLDGETSTLKLAKNPPSADIRQPDLVPYEYKRIIVTMPYSTWLMLAGEAHRSSDNVKESSAEPAKSEILKALKAGEGVAGCQLITDKMRLVLE